MDPDDNKVRNKVDRNDVGHSESEAVIEKWLSNGPTERREGVCKPRIVVRHTHIEITF